MSTEEGRNREDHFTEEELRSLQPTEEELEELRKLQETLQETGQQAPDVAPQFIFSKVIVRVVDTKEPPNPIAGALTTIVGIPPPPASSIIPRRTDENGIAVFDFLSPGIYLVKAFKAEYGEGSERVIVGPGSTIEVTIRLPYGVSVFVGDKSTQQPLKGAKVTFVSQQTGKSFAGETGEDGKATFRLSYGRYDLTVGREGYQLHKHAYNIDAPTGISVWLDPITQPPSPSPPPPPPEPSPPPPPPPTPRYNLEISVVDYKSRPIAGATVNVFKGAENVGSKVTGGDGRVVFQLEQGAYVVEASKSGYKSGRININLSSDAIRTITLSGYQLTIVVLDSSTRQPISGATVKVLDTSGREIDRGVTT